jgi:gold/copper resistance efflux pump
MNPISKLDRALAAAPAFARYFIDRPITAGVLSLLLLIAGLVSLFKLPLSEYPNVAPPTVVVRAAYPGANPKVLADTVSAPLEQEINGVESMLYMNSLATSDGRLTLTITFAQGVDDGRAQIEVQNRVARALPRLPVEVQRLGVVTQKAAPDLLMVVHLVSPDGRYDPLYLSNFAKLQVRDELARLPGVLDVQAFGEGDYSIRVWVDPRKLAARSLTADDVVGALREQNVQVAAGVIGAQPSSTSAFQLPVNVHGRLSDPSEFGQIVVRAGSGGELVYLRDVARVELASSQYALRSRIDNQPAAAILVYKSLDASAITVSKSVRARMQQLSADFPQGVAHKVAYDPTIFVQASIDSVFRTLLEALLLVVLVVILFLQTWRASLIPLLAVPVSLVGTFAAMQVFGFSLNTLSLFGLVLSIGIVVDDAIVVVENVERHLAAGRAPREAAIAAMGEVTRPIIAITSVLAAVFVPTIFMGGLSGQFYQQFALTIAISTVISAFNSLTLSPALAALLLKPHGVQADAVSRWMDRGLGWLFRPFNRMFDRASHRYVGGVAVAVRRTPLVLALFAGLIALAAWSFWRMPTGFVPAQDKYYLVGIVQLPSGASLDRTDAVTRQMVDIALKEPGVDTVVSFPGLSVNGFVNMPNAAVMFAMLKPFDERVDAGLTAQKIAGSLNQKFMGLREGFVGIFPPPPVAGLGVIGGYKLMIEDRAGRGYTELEAATQKFLAEARKQPELAGLFSSYQTNVPQLDVDVDRARAKWLGLDLAHVFSTLQANLGSLYVNDFNAFGRTYPVYVQADAEHRMDAQAIGQLQVRNRNGEMVPLAALTTVKHSSGPDPVVRYNGFIAADVNGGAAPGASSGEAKAAIERVAQRTLPKGFAFEWTDLTYQQARDGDSSAWVFVLAMLLAYLLLAVQFNGFALPLAVVAVVPTVLLSALAGVWMTGGDNNLFTQIGLVVLVGLATKNAILIVEFARHLEDEGRGTVDAVLEASRLRLRPILMTSLAFIMGAVPLVLATGAGAEMRQAMGIAVFAGMLGVTLFGLLLTPVFYVAIRKLALRREARRAPLQSPSLETVHG